MKTLLPVCLLLIFSLSGLAQSSQVCPLNNNFSFGNLTHWEAYTGNNASGNDNQTRLPYDSSVGPPSGTLGANVIYEYNLPSTPGIQIVNGASRDYFGNFLTIPTINGYKYSNSILLGSTAITHSRSGGAAGGYVRGVSYRFTVPAGSPDDPYTMTYAYAMVLENGTHNSNNQPMFKATLEAAGKVIDCASPEYFLPTLNNANNGPSGATLDSALAKSQGFFLSLRPSPNANQSGTGPAGEHLQDVWYKDWTEVTFDLGPYRGQEVVLTFETDNCVPGGHFAYSYVSLRNTCGGLVLSGPESACVGSVLTYSIPALTGATYQWRVPSPWTIVSGADSNILKVLVVDNPSHSGTISVTEQNSCANLSAPLDVKMVPPTVAGTLSKPFNEVCAGTNSTTLTLSGNVGSILNWQLTTDGVHYDTIANTTPSYTAVNLNTTTTYLALVQNGESCSIDTATMAKIQVDPMTVGGSLNPATMLVCAGQDKDALLTLTGQTGTPTNWQSSFDGGTTWTDFAPPDVDSTYEITNLSASVEYRVVVQSGVCPSKISDPAVINYVNVPYPQTTIDPADTLICYNTNATLNAVISVGTNYEWTNTGTLTGTFTGTVPSTPYSISTVAHPLMSTRYTLRTENVGCPNIRVDTFQVRVMAPIIVDAGNDTSVVVGQPLQLLATSTDTATGGDYFTWTPTLGLNDPNIADPIGIYSAETDSIRYTVTATSKLYGCSASAQKLVVVYKTGPDIFVPNAFSPGGSTNNIFRPIPVGIAKLQYFRVYSRWGQLVYSTTQIGQGWDGRQNGQPLPPGAYVWVVQGITYANKVVFHKGTMVLVR